MIFSLLTLTVVFSNSFNLNQSRTTGPIPTGPQTRTDIRITRGTLCETDPGAQARAADSVGLVCEHACENVHF